MDLSKALICSEHYLDFVSLLCLMELKKDANVLTDAKLRQWLEAFLGSSSKDMGWKLEKYLKEIKYEKMVIRHLGYLWMKWIMISGKYRLEYVLEDRKRKKEWRRQMVSKMKPSGLAFDITNVISKVEEEAKKLR
jgi:hypothetical protein